jgi:hypothetical protein
LQPPLSDFYDNAGTSVPVLIVFLALDYSLLGRRRQMLMHEPSFRLPCHLAAAVWSCLRDQSGKARVLVANERGYATYSLHRVRVFLRRDLRFLSAVKKNPQAMRLRRETAEHPFATLRMRMGATHFLMKRLPKVATEIQY